MSEEIVVYERRIPAAFGSEWIVHNKSATDVISLSDKEVYDGPSLNKETLIAMAKIAGVQRLWDCRANSRGVMKTEYDWRQL